MDDAIKYISKVEINNLWGRYDLVWNLEPDVNVLSGINGSGKSTILNCINSLLDKGGISKDPKVENLGGLIPFCDIYINDKLFIHFRNAKQAGVELGTRNEEISSIRSEKTKSVLSKRYSLEYFSLDGYFFLYCRMLTLKD